MRLFFGLILFILLGVSCNRDASVTIGSSVGQTQHAGEDSGHSHDSADSHSSAKEQEHTDEEGVITLTLEQRKELGIKLHTVALSTGIGLGVRTGRVEADPDRKVVVSPQVSGTVQNLPIIVGDRVRRGQVIATLDSPDIALLKGEYHQAEVEVDLAAKELSNKSNLIKLGDESQREVEEARLEVAKAQAGHDGVKARLKSVKLSYERLVQLRQEGIVSAQQVEEARATRQALEADLRQARSELDIAHQHLEREQSVASSKLRQKAERFPAEASLARAKENLKHIRERLIQLGANPDEETGTAKLYSPIDGVVVERPISRGQIASPNSTVAVLVDPSEVWVMVDLQRSDLSSVKVGDPVEVQLVSDAKIVALGTILNINSQVDINSQTVRARVGIKGPNDRLKVGSFVSATLMAAGSALTVPQNAIVEVEGNKVVYVATGDRFIRTPVQIVASGQEQAEVNGLPKGAQVVVQGVNDLKAVDLASEIGGHSH